MPKFIVVLHITVEGVMEGPDVVACSERLADALEEAVEPLMVGDTTKIAVGGHFERERGPRPQGGSDPWVV